MERPPEIDSSLAGATQRIAWRVLAICHNRAELLMVEIQEERERARLVIFLAGAVGILGLLAGITITAAIACAAGAHILLALIIMSVVYLGVVVALSLKLSQMLRHWETLPDSREQLQKDRECLEKAFN